MVRDLGGDEYRVIVNPGRMANLSKIALVRHPASFTIRPGYTVPGFVLNEFNLLLLFRE